MSQIIKLMDGLWSKVFLWSSDQLNSRHFHIDVAEFQMEEARQKTVQYLVASSISVTVFVIAALISLSQFLSPESLAIVVGLFSAAFGFGARTMLSAPVCWLWYKPGWLRPGSH